MRQSTKYSIFIVRLVVFLTKSFFADPETAPSIFGHLGCGRLGHGGLCCGCFG